MLWCEFNTHSLRSLSLLYIQCGDRDYCVYRNNPLCGIYSWTALSAGGIWGGDMVRRRVKLIDGGTRRVKCGKVHQSDRCSIRVLCGLPGPGAQPANDLVDVEIHEGMHSTLDEVYTSHRHPHNSVCSELLTIR